MRADLIRLLGSSGRLEAHGQDWWGIVVPTTHGPVRVRVDLLEIAGDTYLMLLAGGCSERRVSARTVLELNARLPPGFSVVLNDRSMWLRYAGPLAPDTVPRLCALVAREGARFTELAPAMLAQTASCYAAFAD